MAEVMILSEDEVEETDEQPRISVAQNAVGAILDSLMNSASTRVQQGEIKFVQPTVSIHAVNSIVEEGRTAEFAVTTSSIMNSPGVIVSLQVKPSGDFFDFNESITKSVHLQSQKTVEVNFRTLDDDIAEADGQIEVYIIISPTYEIVSGAGQARIIISDLVDRQQRIEEITQASQDILPEITGSIGARTLGTATNRIETAFSETGNLTTFKYDGIQDLKKVLVAGGENLNDDSLTLQNVLGSSSFAISLFPESKSSSLATVWGIGDVRDLNSENTSRQRSWNGDIFTGHFGFDTKVSKGLLTGISASITESEIDHSGATEDELTLKSRSIAINPYLGWSSSNLDAQLKAIAGYGVGEIDIDQHNYELQTVSNSYYTIGVSGNKRIFGAESITEGGESELTITGQSWFASQNLYGVDGLINSLKLGAGHYRIGIEALHSQKFVSGSNVNPNLFIGLRGDNKGYQSIFGMEVSSGISFESPIGISLTGNSNMFLIEQGEIQKWSLLGTIHYDKGKDQLGTFIEISPGFGQMQDNKFRSLWSNDILESTSETGEYINGAHIDSKLGFGIGIFDNSYRLTPFGSIDFAENSNNKYHLGTRIQLGSDLKFELTGSQEFSSEGFIDRKIQLDGVFNW